METSVTYLDCGIFENRDIFDRFYSLCPALRKEKIDAFRFEKDKYLSLGAWILLEKSLKNAGIGRVPDITFNEYGKPFFKGKDNLFFSLSHSGSMALCILSENESGCDIEIIEKPHFEIAYRFFSHEEQKLLCSIVNEDDRKEMFYRIWTLKESFVKATGTGLSESLASFSVLPGEKRLNISKGDNRYSLYEPSGPSGYRCACCIKNHSVGSEITVSETVL